MLHHSLTRCFISSLIVILLISCSSGKKPGSDESGERVYSEVEGSAPAPQFPEGMEWINTRKPLTLQDLRGKVVLLDFWTYACINCLHIIPDLHRLEEKYKDKLVVIGVHSAKFTSERESRNIRQAMERYNIRHPVVNDKNMALWELYDVNAWPTLVLINPEGRIVARQSGEGIYEPFDKLISQVADYYEKKGQLRQESLASILVSEKEPESFLLYPSKVLAHESSNRLFIADTNHNRIVVSSLNGEVSTIVGQGSPGLEDGLFNQARFNQPHGLALIGEQLIVADTGNHAIRLIDFEKQKVFTLAGTGEQATEFNQPGKGRAVPLNSPWDLVIQGNDLFIAMAGFHQIWKMDLQTKQLSVYAGSGLENITDGPLAEAALAQPSGITTNGRKLFIVDSESSSVRSIDLVPYGRVSTLVGTGLFDFGDQDGKMGKGLLQHPQGITYHDGVLYVADTFNNKIKKVFPETKEIITFLGTRKEGLRDGRAPLFNEPGGLSASGENLYVADSNNHVIRVVHLKTGVVSTLNLKEKVAETAPVAPAPDNTVSEVKGKLKVGKAELQLLLSLPEGYELNELAPSRIEVSAASGVSFEGNQPSMKISKPKFPLSIPLEIQAGSHPMAIHWVLYYCEHGKRSLCYFKEAQMPVTVEASASESSSVLKITHTLPVVQ